MKVLITGATGLIGKELTSLLLQNGVSIHYLTTSKRKIENKPNYKGFFWNPSQGIIDENCLMGVDAIIHLAGASISQRWTNSYKQEIVESRIDSSNLLYNALKSNPNQVRQIVSASGTAIYPNSFKAVYTENSPEISDTFLGNVVLKWEEITKELSGFETNTTNNQMELRACIEGLLAVKMPNIPIEIYTDSQYVKNGITQWLSLIHI